jgi:spore photoproduct lyase
MPAAVAAAPRASGAKRWTPRRVVITRSAREHAHGRRIAARCAALGVPVEELPGDRLTGLRGADDRDTYRRAKSTLAVVVAPPSAMRLQPIPPSADWQFHLARGCPAHCQYCYLAGSLPGPPVTRAYANLDEILAALPAFEGRGTVTSRQARRAHEGTTFEASCYTDPLGLEHLTGSLARAVEHFAGRPAASLRFTTKYDDVESLLGLRHEGRTRARFSVNAAWVARRYEGGTAGVPARLAALGRMAGAGYPVGLTIAPIMPFDGWREGYAALLGDVAHALAGTPGADLTVECITHRFTEGSKRVLRGWYPASALEMDEDLRAQKRTRFGGAKHVYPKPVMAELRAFFERELERRLHGAPLLYWT